MDLTKILTDVLYAVTSLLGAYATLYFAKCKIKVDAEVSKIKDDKTKALVNTALERIEDLVVKGVGEAEQTLVGDVKAQIVKGTLSKSDLLKIGQDVANNVYGQLNSETILALQSEYNDIKSYIEASVETQVLKLKITSANIITPTGIANLPQIADTIKPIVEDKTATENTIKPVETVVDKPIIASLGVTGVIAPEIAEQIIESTTPTPEVVPQATEVKTDTVAPVENIVATEAVVEPVKVDVPVAPVATPVDTVAKIDNLVSQLNIVKAQLVSGASTTTTDTTIPTQPTV